MANLDDLDDLEDLAVVEPGNQSAAATGYNQGGEKRATANGNG